MYLEPRHPAPPPPFIPKSVLNDFNVELRNRPKRNIVKMVCLFYTHLHHLGKLTYMYIQYVKNSTRIVFKFTIMDALHAVYRASLLINRYTLIRLIRDNKELVHSVFWIISFKF